MSRVLITGGAGFIGSNLTERLVKEGHEVTIYDNLSRASSILNRDWLIRILGKHSFKLEIADLGELSKLKDAAKYADYIYHLAAQTSVVTSFNNPMADLQSNIAGTLNVLEATRYAKKSPIFVLASSNKVYGGLEEIAVEISRKSCLQAEYSAGIPEHYNLNGNSPYACSKIACEMYTSYYSRHYGLRAIVFRQSCIYGPHQFGDEEQGWVAWLIRAALTRKQISIFGDGKQIRDILWIDDLLNLYQAAVVSIDKCNEHIFNAGGGTNCAISVWDEFQKILMELSCDFMPPIFKSSRSGDQKVYISDIRKAKEFFDWSPRILPKEGISALVNWMRSQNSIIYY